ncbi:MAG: hypothetical protein AAF265_05680 [Pseudomonadota bacterium]
MAKYGTNPSILAKQVIAAFQRYLSGKSRDDIESFSLEDLRRTDEILGDRDTNAGFRIALRNRIKEMESNEERKYESKTRVFDFVLGIAVGVIVSYITRWL